MAALRASMGQSGSLSSPTVAEGLNTISAPFSPKPCAPERRQLLFGPRPHAARHSLLALVLTR